MAQLRKDNNMSLVTLKNDFHNTSCRVRCETLSHMYGEVTIRPSSRQLQRIRSTLCGIKDCKCGKIRGPQTHNGKRLIVDVSSECSGQ